jgi:hypothetical protein
MSLPIMRRTQFGAHGGPVKYQIQSFDLVRIPRAHDFDAQDKLLGMVLLTTA